MTVYEGNLSTGVPCRLILGAMGKEHDLKLRIPRFSGLRIFSCEGGLKCTGTGSHGPMDEPEGVGT